jgi:hypothetical protein
MTETATSVLSTQPARLCHDIQFATALGRDSPFDPFQNRDITKMFSAKKSESSQLMYFTTKAIRKSATAALAFGKSTGREAPTGSVPGPQLTDASYDPVALPEGPKVSFTKAKRKLLAHLPESTQPSSNALRKAEAAVADPLTGALLDEAAIGLSPTTLDELLTSRQRAMKRALEQPRQASSRGVPFGRPPPSPSGSRRAATPSTPLVRTTVSTFPWEVEKQKQQREKRLKEAMRTSKHTPPSMGHRTQSVPLSSLSTPHDDLLLGSATSVTPETDVPQTSTSAPQQHHRSGMTPEEAEEVWLEQRRLFVNRFGLLGGSANRKYSGPSGPSIGAIPGREAPVGFQPRGKECNDVMYVPKYGSTTRTRTVAHVELGKQAARDRGPDLHKRHVEALLNVDYLSKLHQRTREREKRQFAGLDTAIGRGATPIASKAEITDDMSPEDRIFQRPLTAADELAYNTSSLRPASRNCHAVPHTVDSILCADRADEPLASVLGGDPRPYRRAAKRAMSAMH